MPSLVSLLVIAAAWWGQTPACGQPTIQPFQPSSDFPNGVVGYAEVERCRIGLSPRLFNVAGEACMATLHEYGHLLGLDHSTDPNNIMYPVMRPVRWPCAW